MEMSCLHAPAALPSGESLPYPLDSSLVGPKRGGTVLILIIEQAKSLIRDSDDY